MIRTLLFLLLLASPAVAQDSLPALFDVTGVDRTDVLNMRAEPDATSAILGTLASDAQDIEVIRANSDQTWGLVNAGERTAWVSLAYLALQPGQQGTKIPDIRQCFGTEPFWSLTVDPPTASFATPDAAARSGLISGIFRSRNRIDRFAFTGSFFPDDAGVLGMHLSVRAEACSDGMSDRAYGLSIDLHLSGSTDPEAHGLYSGCCSIAPPAK